MAPYLLAIMLAVLPVDRQAPEPPEEALARYESISQAVATVVSRDPLPFGGDLAKERTAVLLLAVSFGESSWRVGVDRGTIRGDGGRSWGLYQANLGPRGRTVEGWTGADLVASHERATTAALAMIRRSAAACRSAFPLGMLRVYASGSCQRGVKVSRERVSMAMRWLKAHPPPKVQAPTLDLSGELAATERAATAPPF